MKHIRRFNENLTFSLDITGGENILDLKIEEDIPEHLKILTSFQKLS